MNTVALTGRKGMDGGYECDIEIRIPSNDTARIQEGHIFALHSIAELVEDACR